MMMTRAALVLTVALALAFATVVSADAQTTNLTVGIFSSTTTNANTATPVATPVSYGSGFAVPLVCGLSKATETAPITNPKDGRTDDPNDPTKDCSFNLTAQMAGLPANSYKGAVRSGAGSYGAVSSLFTLAAQAGHPCDVTPPTQATVLVGARVFGVCLPDTDVNGNPSTVTGWALYVDAAKSTPTGVTVGTTLSAGGKRLYSIPVTVGAGAHIFQAAPINVAGESPKSANFTVTGTQAAALMPAATVQGIQ